MNRTASGFLILEKAIEGFLQFKIAEGLSPNTITAYRHDLKLFCDRVGNISVNKIDSRTISRHLSWLRTDYMPIRMNGKTHPLSNKSLRNHWISLSSFFRWFSNEFQIPFQMKGVPAPKYSKHPIEPFNKADIEALLKTCKFSRNSETHYRKSFVMRRPTGVRDKSIMLTLLDSGMRNSEFCSLLTIDFELSTGKISIQHGQEGGAKGGRGRVVYLGKTARKALWRYLTNREDGDDPNAPLYTSIQGRPLSPNGLRQLISSLGDRAGVSNSYPHRFRHTFAITYLRSGGDIFTLQSLLGHRSLDMVRHYAQIAQIDIEQAHRKASPVDNWRL
jgi:integrase/recombinase XerD